jgi:hypothetical protein
VEMAFQHVIRIVQSWSAPYNLCDSSVKQIFHTSVSIIVHNRFTNPLDVPLRE